MGVHKGCRLPGALGVGKHGPFAEVKGLSTLFVRPLIQYPLDRLKDLEVKNVLAAARGTAGAEVIIASVGTRIAVLLTLLKILQLSLGSRRNDLIPGEPSVA